MVTPRCISLGAESLSGHWPTACTADDGDESGSGLTEEREAANLSLTLILRKLPGVTVNNIRGLLQNVANLREMRECSLEQLAKWMGGVANAKKLHAFMHGQRTARH